MRSFSVCATALLSLLAPVSALAAPPADDGEDMSNVEDVDDSDVESPADPARKRLATINNEATAAYGAHDYDRAIELWTLALGELDEVPEQAASRNLIRWFLVRAHLAAHELKPDLAHLRVAVPLLEDYLANLPEGADRSAAETELARIQAILDEDDAARQREADAAALRAAEAESEGAREAALERERRREEARRGGQRFFVAGGVLLGSGLALAGASGGMMGWGSSLDTQGAQAREDGATDDTLADYVARGRLANGLAIGFAVGGGVLAVAGTSLLVIGARKRRSSRDVSFAPSFGAGGVGIGVRGRF